jgi:S-DNA-T family DNA segregation ATPase FtsK/SpoIIIE
MLPRLRGLRESAFWLLAGASLILLLALTTYSPDDPAYSNSVESATVENLMGPVGAWFADIAFLIFGRSAFLFPVLVLLSGVLLYRAGQVVDNRQVALQRGTGFAMAIATSSGLASLHFSAPELPETAGGLLGQGVGFGLQTLFGPLGATVLLLVLWLSSVSLATGVSWIAVMDRVGRGVLTAVVYANEWTNHCRDWFEGRRARQQRQEIVLASRAKPKREALRIEPTIDKIEAGERSERERQVPLFEPPASSELPALSLLDDPPAREGGYSADALEAMSRLVELKLADFGIEAEVVAVHPGPVVTRFELKPAAGVKVSQISNLAKDLARSLSTVSVRVVEVIPGKPYVGLEIPNEVRELVALGEIIKSEAYEELGSPLTLALGKDIAGSPVVADLARMPHLLIAGTTGSGKSVAINAMVLSLLYKSTPEHVRLIMIDPKMLELSVYEGIPHLLAPVVTDMKQAANALRWCVAEMERRYALMAGLGVRHISGYNKKVGDAIAQGSDLQPHRRGRRSARADAAALHCRDHRRVGRHDDDGRQESRRVDRAAGTEGARLGYPYADCDAAAIRRRHYRLDQGQYPNANRVPSVGQGRFADHPGPDRRRAPVGSRRYALSAARDFLADPSARGFRLRSRGSRRGQGAAPERRAGIHRRGARGAERRDSRSQIGAHGRIGRRARCALRSGR